MDETRNNSGQALVELAFLFPFILLMLACMLQLVMVMQLHMKLHRTAVHMASQLAQGQSKVVLEASALAEYRGALRWGVPIPKAYTETLATWQTYNGIGTTSETNCMAIGEMSYPLMGSWFASVGIRPMILHARAALPCEPTGMAEVS